MESPKKSGLPSDCVFEPVQQNVQEAEEMLKERANELSLLLTIAQDVAQTAGLKPLASAVLDKLKLIVNYTSAAFFTLEGEYLRILDYRGPLAPEEVFPLRYAPEHMPLYQEVLRRGKVCIINDVWSDSSLTRAMQGSVDEQLNKAFSGSRSFLVVPLLAQERVIGMLRIDSSKPNTFTPRLSEIALALAFQVAIAVENDRLHRRVLDLAVLEERQRIANELHDSVSQVLYGIGLGAQTARTAIDNDPKQAIESIEYVISLAAAGLDEIGILIFGLQPKSLQTGGLISALNKQAAVLHARYKLNVNAYLSKEPDIPIETKHALYRIAQEACYNTIKHAQASIVTLQLTRQENEIVLEVHDNGRGFDAKSTFPGHFGLHSMQERVAQLNGSFSIESAAGQGTSICVRIPC